MCTLLSVNKALWESEYEALRGRITQDARSNSDGFALLALDPFKPDNNLRVQSMQIGVILSLVDYFFEDASADSRIFLHSRMATTDYIGIAFNHGFDDRRGRVIMHNGVLWSGKRYAVDSFALVTAPLKDAESLLQHLDLQVENYANCFVIDTNLYTYSVVKVMTGSLYTDSIGNYSTNKMGSIADPVYAGHAEDYYMEIPEPLPVEEEISGSYYDEWMRSKFDKASGE